MLARLLAALLLFICTTAAAEHGRGQGVQQGGTITPNHSVMWSTNGVISDAGPATNGNLRELGITNTGNAFCINSAKAPTPYTQFCVNMGPGGISLTNTSIGGATHVPLNFVVNGFTGLSLTDGGFTLGGTLNVAGGGTGTTSLTSGALLVGNGTGAINTLAPGLNGTCVASNGTAWVASASCGGLGGTVTSVGTGSGLTGGNITTTGVISLANVANGTLLANTTGGLSPPAATTTSALLDYTVAVTRGALLERGVATWGALAPSATVGQALVSNGVGADPSYQNIVNSISSGSGLTINAATGAVSINLGPISNNTMMANTSGVTAAAVSTTPSALWDSAFSNTIGSLFYRSAGGWAAFPPGTSGQVLATTGAGTAPVWQTISGTGTVTSITAGSGLNGGTITGSGTISIAAPIVVSLGGTGQTTITANGVLYGNGTSATAATAAGATSTVLSGNGGGTPPAFATLTSIIDAIASSTQGAVLYRNASAWTALAPGTGGQVLTTGGAAANPSWTSVAGTGTVTSVTCGTGLTGGTFTSSGTCAISIPVGVANGGTGKTTLTNHGVLIGATTSALTISAAGANYNPFVGQGASADPIFVTTSSLLDNSLGSTQGQILYRGASAWTVLNPGTAGQVLISNGAGANPSWVTGGGGSGSVTSITAGTGLTGGTITTTGTIALSVPVGVANGGSGATTFTAHGVLIGEGTGAFAVAVPGTSGYVLTSNGPGADPTWQISAAGNHGAQIGVQVFSTVGSFTYAPDTGTFSVIVECQGAGAAGGGAATTTSGQNSAGAGGAGGSYSRSNISGGFSGATVVVGQGGTAVSGAAGNGGGASSFGGILTCPGGGGGSTPAAGTAVGITSYSAPGAVATGGNLVNTAGQPGMPGICVSALVCQAGAGGVSAMGGGGKPNASGAAGGAANSPGAGGAGALNVGAQSAQSGGPGGNGIVIVYEFN